MERGSGVVALGGFQRSMFDANNTLTRTQPAFPYPTVARYLGSGSTDDAGGLNAASMGWPRGAVHSNFSMVIGRSRIRLPVA